MSRLYDDIMASLNELKEHAEGKSTHLEIIEEYLRTHNPSSMGTEVPFNLRGYISYVDANHITDPDEIPDDIIESFFHREVKEPEDENKHDNTEKEIRS